MFSVEDVKREALALQLSNPDEARRIFLQNIMDWTDSYTENMESAEDSSKDALNAVTCISNLWIEHAKMEISLRQFKKAVQVFDNALEDPIACRFTEVYLSYAKFCKERGKHANAQKVYIKALTGGHEGVDTDRIWRDFLEMMQSQGDPGLTIESLFAAVQTEIGITAIAPPSSEFNSISVNNVISVAPGVCENASTLQLDVAEAKEEERSRVETLSDAMILETGSKHENEPVAQHPITSTALETITSCDGLSIGSIGLSQSAQESNCSATSNGGNTAPTSSSSCVDELDDLTGLTPELLCRQHLRRPPMLFTSPAKEPMLTGLLGLPEETLLKLEEYFTSGDSLSSSGAATSQVSGLSGSGPGVAVKLPRRGIPFAPVLNRTANMVLDLLEALWSVQALKERHFDWWWTDLTKILFEEEQKLLKERTAREAALAGTALEEAKAKNEAELARFRGRCDVQREVLKATVNKTMAAMLLEQQRALAEVGLPFFSAETIERIEASKLSAKKFNVQDLYSFDGPLLEELRMQQRVVCGLLSLRYRGPAAVGMPPLGQSLGLSGKRLQEMGLDPALEEPTSLADFYSQDARSTRRKRRRLIAGGVAPVTPPGEELRLPGVLGPSVDGPVGLLGHGPGPSLVAGMHEVDQLGLMQGSGGGGGVGVGMEVVGLPPHNLRDAPRDPRDVAIGSGPPNWPPHGDRPQPAVGVIGSPDLSPPGRMPFGRDLDRGDRGQGGLGGSGPGAVPGPGHSQDPREHNRGRTFVPYSHKQQSHPVQDFGVPQPYQHSRDAPPRGVGHGGGPGSHGGHGGVDEFRDGPPGGGHFEPVRRHPHDGGFERGPGGGVGGGGGGQYRDGGGHMGDRRDGPPYSGGGSMLEPPPQLLPPPLQQQQQQPDAAALPNLLKLAALLQQSKK